MNETFYNPYNHSEEKIQKYYDLGNKTINFLDQIINQNISVNDVYEKVNSSILYLESLIEFNCWNNYDISTWLTMIQQAKNYLEIFTNA